MNIKGIIGLLLMIFIGFTSCSEETIIGELPYETRTITLNFSMNEGVLSKATANLGAGEISNLAEGYRYSTESELNVNNCFIAIFAKESNEDNWSKRILADNYSPISEGEIGAFKISGLVLPIKTDLKIVAIANLPEDKVDEYKSKSYAELEIATIETAIGGSNYYTFDPSSLIKVGQREVRFNAKGNIVDGNDEETNENTIISLTQLAAKIYLNLDVELPASTGTTRVVEGEYFGDYTAESVLNKLTKHDMNSATSIDKSVYVIVDQNKELKVVTEKDGNDNYLASAYQCGKPSCPSDFQGVDEKYAHVTGLVHKKITTITEAYLFNPSLLSIDNVEKSSFFLSPKGQLNSSTCADPVQITDIAKGITSVKLIFYTYQKPYYQDVDNRQILTVNLEGSLFKGNLEKTEVWKPKGAIHAIWENEKNDGWGDGSSNFKYEYELDGQPNEIVETGNKMEPISNSSFKFEIKINPETETSGIVHGNYYEVIGKLIMNKSSVSLEYQVVDEEPIRVDVTL